MLSVIITLKYVSGNNEKRLSNQKGGKICPFYLTINSELCSINLPFEYLLVLFTSDIADYLVCIIHCYLNLRLSKTVVRKKHQIKPSYLLIGTI